jgi:hypothetical protein
LLEILDRVDPDQARLRRVQFFLQWAWRKRQARQYESALDIYTRNVIDLAPQIGRDRIELTLGEAEQWAWEQDRPDSVAELYERYGLPHAPEFSRPRLAQLWRDQGQRFLRGQEFEPARRALEKAEGLEPGAARLDLLRVDYLERSRATGPGDLVARYELGVWCLKNDLLEEALTELRQVRRHDVIGENARAQIQQVRHRMAEKQLEHLMDLYDQGQYIEAISGVQGFFEEGFPAGFRDQASQIEQLARDKLRLVKSERPQQAEGIFQQAERAFYDRQYPEADRLLLTVLDRFADTDVAERARRLQVQVKDKLDLMYLEQGLPLPALDDSSAPPTSTAQPATTSRTLERTTAP